MNAHLLTALAVAAALALPAVILSETDAAPESILDRGKDFRFVEFAKYDGRIRIPHPGVEGDRP